MRRLPAYLYLLSPLDNLTLNSLPTMMLLAGAMHTAHLTHNDAAGVLHVMLALCAHNKAAPTVGWGQLLVHLILDLGVKHLVGSTAGQLY